MILFQHPSPHDCFSRLCDLNLRSDTTFTSPRKPPIVVPLMNLFTITVNNQMKSVICLIKDNNLLCWTIFHTAKGVRHYKTMVWLFKMDEIVSAAKVSNRIMMVNYSTKVSWCLLSLVEAAPPVCNLHTNCCCADEVVWNPDCFTEHAASEGVQT